MKKKLLLVNPNYQYGYGAGYPFYPLHLKNEFDIDFICFDKHLQRIDSEGFNVIYLDAGKYNRVIRLLYFTLYVIRHTRSKKFDILITVYYKLAAVIGLFAHSKNKIIDIRTGSLNKISFFRYLNNSYYLFSTIFFNKVITLSTSLSLLLKLPIAKTQIVPLGGNIINCEPKNFDDLNLLYVGVISKRNIHQTIEGISVFLKKYGNFMSIKYTIIGNSLYKEDVELINEIIVKERLQQIVFYKGYISNNLLLPYYEEANIGISYIPMTKYYDCQPPTKTFEYILAGMVCVATNTSENRMIINKSNGVLCNDNPISFANALFEIYQNRHSYNSKNIRVNSAIYTWENVSRNVLLPFLLSL